MKRNPQALYAALDSHGEVVDTDTNWKVLRDRNNTVGSDVARIDVFGHRGTAWRSSAAKSRKSQKAE